MFCSNFSRVHMFCSNFSRVRMFCDDDHSKLEQESTRPGGFPSWTMVDNLHDKLKSEYLILKQKVWRVWNIEQAGLHVKWIIDEEGMIPQAWWKISPICSAQASDTMPVLHVEWAHVGTFGYIFLPGPIESRHQGEILSALYKEWKETAISSCDISPEV